MPETFIELTKLHGVIVRKDGVALLYKKTGQTHHLPVEWEFTGWKFGPEEAVQGAVLYLRLVFPEEVIYPSRDGSYV